MTNTYGVKMVTKVARSTSEYLVNFFDEQIKRNVVNAESLRRQPHKENDSVVTIKRNPG